MEATATRIAQVPAAEFVEEVQIAGHIIDSLILPKVLDLITAGGGTFRIKKITIGQTRKRSQLCPGRGAGRAAGPDVAGRFWARSATTGGVPTAQQDCRLVAADMAGLSRRLLQLDQPADRSAHRRPLDRSGTPTGDGLRRRRRSVRQRGRCVPMSDVRSARCSSWATPACACFRQSAPPSDQAFEFMASSVSTEKPKGVAIRRSPTSCFTTAQRAARRCWSAGRRSCTPAAASTSAG